MTAPAGTVLVVDDDGDLAASLVRLLGRTGFTARAFTDPEAVLATADLAAPCCILSDVMMGRLNGFDFARAMRARLPEAAFIFMTAWPRTRDAVMAIRDLDGIDYLEKPLDQDALTGAIRSGLAWSARHHALALRLAPLSARERQILLLLGRGHTNKAIALELDLSVRTVEDHRAAIMRKTGSNGLAQLIALTANAG